MIYQRKTAFHICFICFTKDLNCTKKLKLNLEVFISMFDFLKLKVYAYKNLRMSL